MNLQIPDALLLILLAGAVGLGAGWGLSTWAARRRRLDGTASKAAAQPQGSEGVSERVADADPGRSVPQPQPEPQLARPAPTLPPAADLLLVDDSAVARAKLRRMFEGAGYQVHLASDGVEALALLEKGHYSMLITDLEMPNMDGVTLINTCLGRPQTASMPILAISGHESLRAKFNECRDICGIHRKPWVDDILLSHVATLVGARPRRTTIAVPHGAREATDARQQPQARHPA